MKYYVVFLSAGEAWEQNKNMDEQDLQSHRDYWRPYRGEKMIAGGPLEEMEGLIILQVDTREEATDLANGDPAVQKGIFTAKVYVWQPLFTTF